MEQHLKNSKADILDHDLSIHKTSCGSNLSSNSLCDDPKSKKRDTFSEEELKIRSELENDIERNLEEEIKDGIYHLALRLHRLYLHQKERDAREAYELYGDKKRKNKVLSEVNISIRMEGGTKIEIKESRKEEDPDKGRPWTPSSSENIQAMLQQVSKHKKFDWANSLRSGTDPGAINKKNSRLQKTALGWQC
ncbi:uncharacterized protein LOC116144093 [Pistacia vera]|uniref:uncharacterized protein LOC116144092 n=1 Tax=Pistacia vera TaxID=55513 RepID=UPI0012639D57|nr:uncharacterized protein LOC116144092 [Pistacia vera]XP_031285406.1 uncharacterized protein LOC116144093 [Pistacia vera]